MSVTDRDRAKARKLLDELTFGGHSQDGAESIVAADLADERQPFLDLAEQLEADAETGEYAGGHWAGDVLYDVARRIRRAAGAMPVSIYRGPIA